MHFKRASMTAAALAGVANSAAIKERANEPVVVVEHIPAQFMSTVYATSMVTIQACGPEVTNCPASSTGDVLTSIVPEYTTVCPLTLTSVGTSGVPTGPAPASLSTVTIVRTSTRSLESSPAATSFSVTDASASTPPTSTPATIPVESSSSSATGVVTGGVTGTASSESSIVAPASSIAESSTPAAPSTSVESTSSTTVTSQVTVYSTISTAPPAYTEASSAGSASSTIGTPTEASSTSASANTVNPVTATGTGSVTTPAYNGTVSATQTPSQSVVPYTGGVAAKGLDKAIGFGLAIGAAVLLV